VRLNVAQDSNFPPAVAQVLANRSAKFGEMRAPPARDSSTDSRPSSLGSGKDIAWLVELNTIYTRAFACEPKPPSRVSPSDC
jgi:hypothetical protein